ncbi:hypothetical protein E2C01_019018 [Portunus trituberculatus]|uniref:Uncharacterized protein n=1 Tax=Portunus trituberculatus TaxID=210409 RepID=A0A5B7DYP1_PORTR|nr:hypothetical protein [Portunus trituberculatus]
MPLKRTYGSRSVPSTLINNQARRGGAFGLAGVPSPGCVMEASVPWILCRAGVKGTSVGVPGRRIISRIAYKKQCACVEAQRALESERREALVVDARQHFPHTKGRPTVKTRMSQWPRDPRRRLSTSASRVNGTEVRLEATPICSVFYYR